MEIHNLKNMNPKEQFKFIESKENPDEQIRRELEAEGWQRASGIESTHTTPLNPKTGRFEPKAFRRPEDIKREYLEKYEPHGFTEIKLVYKHSQKGNIGFVEDPYSYYVYMRRLEDKKSS